MYNTFKVKKVNESKQINPVLNEKVPDLIKHSFFYT